MVAVAERQKILLIDDTPAILHVLNNILKDDYDIIVAKSGEQGLLSAKKFLPDLILLDVLMPGLSGYDVLETLKSDDVTKSIPVMLISGMDSDEDEVKGYELGAADYIKKPFVGAAVKHRVDFNMQFILMRNIIAAGVGKTE